jgi:hypothetical protein
VQTAKPNQRGSKNGEIRVREIFTKEIELNNHYIENQPGAYVICILNHKSGGKVY